MILTILLIPDEGPSLETSNSIYRIDYESILWYICCVVMINHSAMVNVMARVIEQWRIR